MIARVRKITRTEDAVIGSNDAKLRAEMKELALTFYTNNQSANAHKATADKARKLLYKKMKTEEIKNFELDATLNADVTVALSVEIVTPEREFIDVSALRKLVDDKTFMQIVSATKKDVTEMAGGAVVVRCARVGLGTENVVVKEREA